MKLDPIGRVDDPAALNLDPIIVPVVAYRVNEDGDPYEVVEEFEFRPVQPAGAAMELLRATDANGNVSTGLIMAYLDESLMPDSKEPWDVFMHDPATFIEQTTLIDVYRAIMDVYSARPTLPPSDSDGGGSSTKRTSRAASRSAASRSRPSRSA